MAKFVYRMQNILDIKYKLETQAKTAYAQANSKLRSEELRLETIYDDINKYKSQIIINSEDTVNVSELKWCSQAIELKKKEAEEQKKRIEKARKELEIARIKLNEVMIERKTHEKLRENAFEEFKQEIAYSENKEIDEIVSYIFSKPE